MDAFSFGGAQTSNLFSYTVPASEMAPCTVKQSFKAISPILNNYCLIFILKYVIMTKIILYSMERLCLNL